MAAPTAIVPDTVFATLVTRLLHACVRACTMTNGMTIRFVQARQLNLQIFFSEAERMFRIHDRWLSIDGAIEELGLVDNLAETDIVFHAVKSLFAGALEQLPREAFVEEGSSRTAEWRRKLETSRAEQRLLNYLRIGRPSFGPTTGYLELCVRWVIDSPSILSTEVEIQCHPASQCTHIRESVLIAEDGTYLLLT